MYLYLTFKKYNYTKVKYLLTVICHSFFSARLVNSRTTLQFFNFCFVITVSIISVLLYIQDTAEEAVAVANAACTFQLNKIKRETQRQKLRKAEALRQFLCYQRIHII